MDNARVLFNDMNKVVENLIKEKDNLLASKHALSIAKIDLLLKADTLNKEIDVLRNEISIIKQSQTDLKSDMIELEDKLEKLKNAVMIRNDHGDYFDDDDDNVPELKRTDGFMVIGVAQIMVNSHQYKERFLSLQKALSYCNCNSDSIIFKMYT